MNKEMQKSEVGDQRAEVRGSNPDRVASPAAGRARHSVRAANQPRRIGKLEARDQLPPLPRERAGVRGIVAQTLPTAPYTLPKTILEKIWLERLRQKQLVREGRIGFACDSPVVSHDRKLRVLTEELGEIARAIDRIENCDPLRRPRAELSDASARARKNLCAELTQVAAVAIAWLESLPTPTSADRGSASRSVPPETDVMENSARLLQPKPLRVTDPRSETHVPVPCPSETPDHSPAFQRRVKRDSAPNSSTAPNR